MSTWMKDGLTALVLGLAALVMVLLGGLKGSIVIWLPIGMFIISFLSDTWWHRKKSPRSRED